MKLAKHPVIRFVSSYGLGLIVLLFMMVLLVLGTLYQADYGLFRAQQKFYHSYLIAMPVLGSEFKIPLPGARLLMVVLFINILTASIFRLRFSKRTLGVYIVHAGILILLGGGFLTAYGSSEGYMDLEEGDASNFSTRFFSEEIAIVREDGPGLETVTTLRKLEHVKPETILVEPSEELPFTLQVVQIFHDCVAEMDNTGRFARELGITDPFTQQLALVHVPPGPQDAKFLSGVFRIIRDGEPDIVCIMADSLNRELEFQVDGTTYRLSLRNRRDYHPFTIYLRDFQRETYPGTMINSSYTSYVDLVVPEESLERHVRIYMNHPLRYGNYTFYQASFDKEDTVSVLQVVYNPGLPFPYISAVVVAIGLTMQFVYVLLSRAALRRKLVDSIVADA